MYVLKAVSTWRGLQLSIFAYGHFRSRSFMSGVILSYWILFCFLLRDNFIHARESFNKLLIDFYLMKRGLVDVIFRFG